MMIHNNLSAMGLYSSLTAETKVRIGRGDMAGIRVQ